MVDVTDFNDKTWLDSARAHTAMNCTWWSVTRRSGPNTINYEATIEDPKTYSLPVEDQHAPCIATRSRISN